MNMCIQRRLGYQPSVVPEHVPARNWPVNVNHKSYGGEFFYHRFQTRIAPARSTCAGTPTHI